MVGLTGFKYEVEKNTPKYLVVCDGGNVRSSALASTLKLDYGREAINIGRLFVSPETMAMLSEWADKIVLMQPHMAASIPYPCRDKTVIADVGEDRWGIYIHPELNKIVNDSAKLLVESE